MVNGESETIWNGTVTVHIEVLSASAKKHWNPRLPLLASGVEHGAFWIQGIISHRLIVIIGLWDYGLSYLTNVKICYWHKIVRFPLSDIQSLYTFSVLVGYCAEFMVYPSGFWCFVPINQCYGSCQVEVTLMPAVNTNIWTKIDCLCLLKDGHLS